MESRNTIAEELKTLYPAVANLSRKNVYSVPPYYFDTLAEKIFNRIKDGKEQKVLDIPSAIPFNVPQGYFDSLAANILQKAKSSSAINEIVEELKRIAPLLNSINKQPVYSIPAGYFENFKVDVGDSNEIATELKAVAPALIGINKKPVYSVPANYFEKFKVNVGRNEIANELNDIAPLLNTISKQNVYSVPTGYFESLEVTTFGKNEIARELNEIAPLLNTISKETVYSVPAGYFDTFKVPMPVAKERPKLSFIRGGAKVIRYAAAAVVTGIIGTASFFFIQEDPVKPTGAETTKQISFKQEQIKTLTDDEIIEYLNSTSSSLDAITRPADDNQDDLFDNSIEEMSDEEIREYLQEYAEPTELNKKQG